MQNFTELQSFDEGDACPVHNNEHRKVYTFGSSMSAETDVCVFHGCKCAVSIARDPIGILPAVVRYHDTFAEASGVGKLRAESAAAKYR